MNNPEREEFPESNDPPFDLSNPHGWIQWKGTHVCIDMTCECGEVGHYDGDFLYYFKCSKCSQVYQVGAYIKLYPLEFEPKGTKMGGDDD